MPYIEWDDTLSMDIPDVDAQHKNLVQMLQTLEKAVQETPTSEQIYTSILDMMEFASVHFCTEENLMKPYAQRVPSYEEHVYQHKEFMKITLEFMSRFREEGPALAGEMSAFLYSWIVNHIRVVDRAMHEELRSLGAL